MEESQDTRGTEKLLTWLRSQQPTISSLYLKPSRMAISEHMTHHSHEKEEEEVRWKQIPGWGTGGLS